MTTPASRATHGRTLLLAGPTASGKSAVALHLAELLGGEIVSVDSMQVYRGMDVGTAKPGPEEQARVRHHLIDVADPRETFSAGRFLELAEPAVKGIHERGRLALLCGGTGLYFRAWQEGIGEAPPADAALRRELESVPLQTLLTELTERDPEAAGRIDPRNRRRVVRAVEVLRLSGQTLSQQRSVWHQGLAASPEVLVCLDREPAELKQRIDERVDTMFARDLVGETRRLVGLGLTGDSTALQAIGYRQVMGHLQGERSLPETVALVKQRTHQFAKRQRTWFRHQPGVVWLRVPEGESVEETGLRIRTLG